MSTNTNTTGSEHAGRNNTDATASIGGGAINERQRQYVNRSPGVKGQKSPQHQQRPGVREEATPGNPHPQKALERESAYNPSRNRSHLFHAIEGLHRYPNYLSRWSLEDTESLEQALQDRLEAVRRQKETVVRQREDTHRILESFLCDQPEWQEFVRAPLTWEDLLLGKNLLDDRLKHVVVKSKFFVHAAKRPLLQDVLSGNTAVELDAGLLEDWMDEELDDVYSCPILSPTFCEKLQQFFSQVMNRMETVSCVNRNIHRDLDALGLGWLNDLLFHFIVRPVAAQLYRDSELAGGDLDWRQGYIAAYSASPTEIKPRQRLVPHTDDSEITLNICLGDEFDGGLLNFWGIRGSTTAGQFVGEYTPQVGRGIFHVGRHLHEVTEVTSGNRFAYIQWARSWSGARSVECPCCWLNRRGRQPVQNRGGATGDSCICGGKWN